jgi:CRISPR-associated endonuclease/helicase Cas3
MILMGGEELDAEANDWDIHPEVDTILIGTQDMLLSRALNRGYGLSRYRWPMHFGLLNNDCLWVMDETQLMGPGLGTACQLEAFRNASSQGFDSYGCAGSVTWYMSATNNPEHLRTREWRNVARKEGFEFGLTPEEKSATTGPVHRRRHAVKRLELKPELSFENAASTNTLVTDILKHHGEMLVALADNKALPARTLIICNTVDRAVAIHTELAKNKPEGCDLRLLHSRFRPPERRAQMEHLKTLNPVSFPKGQIVVSTQVIEAGVDVSSGILWSEVAPLASLVQRLGRVNRAGEFNESTWKPVAFIVGVGVKAESEAKNDKAREDIRKANTGRCLPYELPSCSEEAVWQPLQKLNVDASPARLEMIQSDIARSIECCPYSLQRHELLDFFDTDANLSLGFTDVSPFVRGLDDDTDLQVLWRESWPQKKGEAEGTGEPGFSPDFQRDELCTIPIGKWRNDAHAREVLNHGWLWRGKDSGWMSVRDAGLAPGMTILLPVSAGGYDTDAGWTGEKAHNVFSPHYQPREWPSDEDQLSLLANGWQSIEQHTGFVAQELGELLRHLLLDNKSERHALTLAVPWHDIGKNHPDWQQAVVTALEKAGITGKEAYQPFAKFSLSDSPQVQMRNPDDSPKFTGKQLYAVLKTIERYFRPGLAHEVASALAFRQAEQKRLGLARDTDLASLLAEYVIMSHHGRVRKVLRDELPRHPSDDKDTDTVRGVSQGSSIPPVPLLDLGCDSLSTDCRKMGRSEDGHESYTRGVLRLLDHYGPFRLAFFEALFRAADMRASAKATASST